MQGSQGPGSLQLERRRDHPSPEPGAILRRGDDREKTIAGMANAEPLVNVLVRAGLHSTNTINSIVNGYVAGIVAVTALSIAPASA